MSHSYAKHKARQESLQKLGKELARRSKSCCELCGENTSLRALEVPPLPDVPSIETTLFVCDVCQGQIRNPKTLNPQHWYGLQEKIWSEHAVVQVMSWRVLQQLQDEGWVQDLLDQIYLEEDVLQWAQNVKA